MFTDVKVDKETFSALGKLPECTQCGGLARPNILMFDDDQWIATEMLKQKMHMYYWWKSITENHGKIAVIEIGAGTAIKTVRNQSESLLNYDGTTLIRINPRDFEVPIGHLSIPETALAGVGRLVDRGILSVE